MGSAKGKFFSMKYLDEIGGTLIALGIEEMGQCSLVLHIVGAKPSWCLEIGWVWLKRVQLRGVV